MGSDDIGLSRITRSPLNPQRAQMGHFIRDRFFKYFLLASSPIAFSNSKNTTIFDLTKVEPLFCCGLFKSSLLLPYIFQIIFCIIKYGFWSIEVDKTFIHLWVLYYLFGSLTLDCRLVRPFIEPQP